MAQSGRIASLYRYPVKGMKPQPLRQIMLTAGETLPWDRAFAIENGPSPFDPENPAHLEKINFLMLMRNEKLAALDSHFDEASQTLTISRDGQQVAQGALDDEEGRRDIEAFLTEFMSGALNGPPRILRADGHSFSDVAAKCVHLINLASVAELEKIADMRLDPLRFRANIHAEGLDAWAEKDWVGKTIQIGTVRLEVFSETSRCAATDVDPASAQRNTRLARTLLKTYGHSDFGVYATVVSGGEIRIGDDLVIAS